MYDKILKKKLQYTFSGTDCDVFKGSTHHGGLGLSFRFSKLCAPYLTKRERSKESATAGRDMHGTDALEDQGPALRLTDLWHRHKLAVSEDAQHAWASWP